MHRLTWAGVALTTSLAVAACGSASTASTGSKTSPTPGGRGGRAANGASGELVKITGTTLVLSATNGTDTTVTFAQSVPITKTSTGTFSDITVGSCVQITGQKDGSGTVTATTVRVSAPVSGSCTPAAGFGGTPNPNRTPNPNFSPPAGAANLAVVRGEVASITATAVTVTLTAGGSQTVTVPPTLSVSKSSSATAADLVVGACVAAIGAKDAGGTVTASALTIQPAGPSGCFTGARGGRGGFGAGGAGGFGGGGFGGRPGGGGAAPGD